MAVPRLRAVNFTVSALDLGASYHIFCEVLVHFYLGEVFESAALGADYGGLLALEEGAVLGIGSILIPVYCPRSYHYRSFHFLFFQIRSQGVLGFWGS